ncbi:MAG: ATP-binding protein [Ignavibacteriaceae bacterium]|nr:ATP-binding protein [Ignavibacteriaceae bacterium]
MSNYIKRDLETELGKFLSLQQILAIIGPRRSGKTTLIKRLQSMINGASYISFENFKLLELFASDLDNFIRAEIEPYDVIIIDEFQYAKEGGKRLKYIYDLHPGKKIIISGSSSIDITVEAVKYLVGRILVFHLYPFNFGEFILARDNSLHGIYRDNKNLLEKGELPELSSNIKDRFNRLLSEYLIFGGYPEVVLAEDHTVKIKLLESIYSLYFLREVKDLLGLAENYKLKILLKALALQIGNLIAYNELSSLSSSTALTVKNRLSLFENTFVSYSVTPFHTNKRTELVKNPKPYFFDPGFRNIVIDNFLKLENRQDTGALRENFAANSLRTGGTLNFWRTKNGADVDFVREIAGEVIPYEIKTRVYDTAITTSLKNFISNYHPAKAYVFTLDFTGRAEFNGTEIYFVPLFLI